MPLYLIDDRRRAHPLVLHDQHPAAERGLQRTIESSLKEIFDVRFVGSEVRCGNGRADTLGLDEDGNPVVIEYKRGRDDKVVVQALSYVAWISEHREDFENHVRAALGETPVIWDTPRVIVVAASFNEYDVRASSQYRADVMMMKYRFYSQAFDASAGSPAAGDLTGVLELTPAHGGLEELQRQPPRAASSLRRSRGMAPELQTEGGLETAASREQPTSATAADVEAAERSGRSYGGPLGRESGHMELLEALRHAILAFGSDVNERRKTDGTYVYERVRKFADVTPVRHGITVFANGPVMGRADLTGLDVGHHGNDYTTIRLTSADHLDQVVAVLRAAYDARG